jgi:hypothetical protein
MKNPNEAIGNRTRDLLNCWYICVTCYGISGKYVHLVLKTDVSLGCLVTSEYFTPERIGHGGETPQATISDPFQFTSHSGSLNPRSRLEGSDLKPSYRRRRKHFHRQGEKKILINATES